MAIKGAHQVIYGKRTKRITLQRALVAKFIHFPEKASLKDLLILFDNLLWLQEKCETDTDFRKKFGLSLKVLAYILKHMNLSKHTITEKQILVLSKKFKNNLTHFSLEKRNTLQPLQHSMRTVEVRVSRPLGVPKKQLPPEQYIGKGYRDKGSAKKPWIDGSQTWQEIASAPIRRLEHDTDN